MNTSRGERLKRASFLAALLALAGCASSWNDGSGLLQGRSSAADVEAAMGRPAEILELAGGQQLWFYPRGPYLRQTYAVRLGPDKVLMGIEERLTKAHVNQIVPGMPAKDVRNRLGPPVNIVYMPFLQRDVWEYWVSQIVMHDQERLWIQFSGDGIVREVLLREDPESINVDPGCILC